MKPQPKKESPPEKSNLHPRNKHRERYNFQELIGSCPDLASFVRLNEYGDESVDFADPKAVLALNKALLKHFYDIEHWNIPDGYLCPPIPGRADYIHYVADLLGSGNGGKVPTGSPITCLDIGVGANCIYPIIGHKEYGWSFVGSDIEKSALASAAAIVNTNPSLTGNVELRLQENPRDVFRGLLYKDELFDVCICNPPFHSSFEEAQAGSLRKLSNLSHRRVTKTTLNFGGQNHELWCEGGEEQFVKTMISQSRQMPDTCFWFTTLIAKQAHIKTVQNTLKSAGVVSAKMIEMNQGNKISRIVAWTFLSREKQEEWVGKRWK